MKRIMLALLIFLTVFNVKAVELNNNEAEAFVKKVSKNSQTILNDTNLSKKQKEEKYKDFTESIIDDEWIAKFVLGSHWKEINKTQQKDFMKLYKIYLLTTYMPKLKNYSKDLVIKKVTSRKKDVYVVDTMIKDQNDKDVAVSFRLSVKNNNFYITDIIPEGISFISSQRTDIDSAFSTNGFDKFMQMIQKKINK
jgi:ABC-type transporter MlaC component